MRVKASLEEKTKMQKVMIAIVMGLAMLTASVKSETEVAPLTVDRQPTTGPQLGPQPAWNMLRQDALPTLPPGWVVINMMPLIQNGNSMAAVQIFLHNNATRANAVWLVRL
jgi:hypothetical protein